jgi:hypothetical protein
MPFLEAYLQRQYWRMLDRPIDSQWLVIDTDTTRPGSEISPS